MARTSSSSVLARILTRSRLRHWYLISKIAELGTLQAGATAVGMSQPAATKALSDVESIVGFPLFERNWKGARLSAGGNAILPRIRAAIGIFEDCASTISEFLEGGTSEVTVGAIDAAVAPLLSKALLIFGRKNPDVIVTVQQNSVRALLQLFQDRAIDIALLRCPPEIPVGSKFDPLVPDRYTIVAAPGHPALQLTEPTLDQLWKYTWLPPPRYTVSDRDFSVFWGELGTPPKLCRLATLSVPLMLATLENRKALTLIPRNLIADFIGSKVFEIAGAWGPPLADVGVLYRVEAVNAQAQTAQFLSALRQRRSDDMA